MEVQKKKKKKKTIKRVKSKSGIMDEAEEKNK